MYSIRLGTECVSADGVLRIHNSPGEPMPYITIEKDQEIVFFAPFDTITFVKKQ